MSNGQRGFISSLMTTPSPHRDGWLTAFPWRSYSPKNRNFACWAGKGMGLPSGGYGFKSHPQLGLYKLITNSLNPLSSCFMEENELELILILSWRIMIIDQLIRDVKKTPLPFRHHHMVFQGVWSSESASENRALPSSPKCNSQMPYFLFKLPFFPQSGEQPWDLPLIITR